MRTLTPQWCRRRRLALGWTQEDLAERAGVPQASVSLYESGKRGLSPEAAARMSEALAVRPGVLLGRHREKVKEIAARHRMHNVRVFGSVAQHRDTPDSDVDLLIDVDDSPGLVMRMSQAQEEMAEVLSTDVDLVIDEAHLGISPAATRAKQEALEL